MAEAKMAQQHLQFDEDKKKTLSENQMVSNILREPVVIQKLVSQKKLDINRVVSIFSLCAVLFNIALVSVRFFSVIVFSFFT